MEPLAKRRRLEQDAAVSGAEMVLQDISERSTASPETPPFSEYAETQVALQAHVNQRLDRIARGNVYKRPVAQGNARQHNGDHNQIFNGPVYIQPDSHVPRDTQSEAVDLFPELAALKFGQMDFRFLSIEQSLADTCEWVLDTPEYGRWSDNTATQRQSFLWITGKAGAGKSTVMKHLVMMHEWKGGSTVASFFFTARGDSLEKSPEGMFRSLLFQLFDQLPDLLHATMDDSTPTGKRRRSLRQRQGWTLALLQDVFRDAALKLGSRRLVCYIDALDECSEDAAREMIEFFGDLGASTTTKAISFSVCFSSRPYPNVRLRSGDRLVLEEQQGHLKDIAKYIQQKLELANADLKTDVSEKIGKRSRGVFLWVVLVLRVLNEESARGNTHAVHKRLDELPDKLNDVFDGMIQRGRQTMYFDPLLRWLLYARRPLTCLELWSALRCLTKETAEEVEGHEAPDAFDAFNFILDCSKGLVELTKGNSPHVQFIHESVRTYLKGHGLSKVARLAPIPNSSMAAQSHDVLKTCCYNYLFTFVPKVFAKTPKYRKFALGRLHIPDENWPFLEYSTSRVLDHAEEALRGQVPQDDFVAAFPLGLFTLYLGKTALEPYTTHVTKAYIFARLGYSGLLSIAMGTDTGSDVSEERCSSLLGAAVESGNLDCVTALLERGANPSSKARGGKSCMLRALERDTLDLVGVFLDAGVKPYAEQEGESDCVKAAAYKGRFPPFEVLLSRLRAGRESCSDRLAQSLNHALHTVCQHNKQNAKLIDLLVEKGADVNAIGGTYGFPLQAACYSGDTGAVRVLLGKGALVNAQGGTHGCALNAACLGGSRDIVQVLLDEGADVDATGSPKDHPLKAASTHGEEGIVRMLVEAGADINKVHSASTCTTALIAAAAYGHAGTVRYLLDHGADPEITGNVSKRVQGCSALHAAAHGGYTQIVQELLSRGADIGVRGGWYDSPLQCACIRGHVNTARVLIDHGADVHAREGVWGSSLIAACSDGHISTVRLLLSHKADVHSRGPECYTPLLAVAKCWVGNRTFRDKADDCIAITTLLLEMGADRDVKDHEGHTAVDLVRAAADGSVMEAALDRCT